MDEIHSIAREFNIPVIEDAAHALGAKYNGKFIGEISEFTMFSFQAIKHLTTGDGGMLVFKNHDQLRRAQRLRWFGIDRSDKQKGIWENDKFIRSESIQQASPPKVDNSKELKRQKCVKLGLVPGSADFQLCMK
jgi:dTDP-4-amino-4,6-dideoxygalactose transaminase